MLLSRLVLLVGILFCNATLVVSAKSVAEYHGGTDRSGHYVVSGLGYREAAATRQDRQFDGRVEGQIIAQPLYWEPDRGGPGEVIVATNSNIVSALDAISGKTIWTRTLGDAATPLIPCGRIGPIGLGGTPVLDADKKALYLDTVVNQQGMTHHLLFGLSLADGSILPGWPLKVFDELQRLGIVFDDRIQEQRGALTILNGRLYVPFGGYGDCGPYQGRVIAVDLAQHAIVAAWSARGDMGGIWAAGGVLSDGHFIVFATGNTKGASTWSDGEAIFRLGPDLEESLDPPNFFTPKDWKRLDEADSDLGGSAPTLVDIASASIPHLLLGLGKDGNAYLLNRDCLPGIGDALATFHASDQPIISATATYKIGTSVLIAVQAHGISCPSPYGLMVLRVTETVQLQKAWCSPLDGRGAPVVTTSDADKDPIIWVVGAHGDNRLHAFRGDTGEQIFLSPALPAARRYASVLVVAAQRRLYLAVEGGIISFLIQQ